MGKTLLDSIRGDYIATTPEPRKWNAYVDVLPAMVLVGLGVAFFIAYLCGVSGMATGAMICMGLAFAFLLPRVFRYGRSGRRSAANKEGGDEQNEEQAELQVTDLNATTSAQPPCPEVKIGLFPTQLETVLEELQSGSQSSIDSDVKRQSTRHSHKHHQ